MTSRSRCGRPAVLALVAAASTVALGTAACGGSTGSAGGTTSSRSSSSSLGLSGSITVFAAASLKRTFTRIGADFEKAHPGTTVTFSFAGSSDLVAQIQQGAPADVFASADTENMDKATAESLTAATPVVFASNTLEIAVPPGNPAKVASLADLGRPGVKVVLCAPAVPCGAAAAKVEQAAGVDIKPVSEEQSVTDVLGKVSAGEADAGLVYVTDVKGAGDSVQGITFPQSSAVVNSYPVASLKSSRNKAVADAFVAAVTSSAGQQVLAAAGFAEAP
ncbi:molybdate ABC transporter substrate-binding protein [Phycicoccus sp. Soil748]|uniref:molybdate ABC transporter substrate-binding protein n=1 Tax=Phycicoccus sp. Soil748 TaxID=1736397 RepID=UPI0007027110|nr:molybdate ABC transporter substrate-binding protein [Phycicoccus sp. Soil748]KRE58973.1 molybdate-binding protein [Phycicoccus sp. Soil748]